MSSTHFHNGQQVSDRWNQVFRALAAEPRRQIITALMDVPPNESVPLPESAIMPNAPIDPNAMRVELHHIHLPLLADLDIIQWNDTPLAATRGPQFDDAAYVLISSQSYANDLPDSPVIGCQRFEQERQKIS